MKGPSVPRQTRFLQVPYPGGRVRLSGHRPALPRARTQAGLGMDTEHRAPPRIKHEPTLQAEPPGLGEVLHDSGDEDRDAAPRA